MTEQMLTPEEVAGRLRVTAPTVYTWLRAGRLKGIKMGRLWRIRPAAVDAFLSDPNGGTLEEARTAVARRLEALERIVSRPIHGLRIPDEALSRENLYKDRV
jgi:excisionase family DNA binding protein